MTRSFRLLFGFLLAVLLTSCAGRGTGVDEAANASAASVAALNSSGGGGSDGGSQDGGQTDAAPTGQSGGGGGGGRGLPGAPGGDQAGGGEDKGNPGAPGDVAVFEEGGGASYGALRDDAATKCAGGVCRLLSPVILDGNPDDVGGVDGCSIQEKTDILYDPPAQGGFFQKGATVTAQVHCASEDNAGGSSDGETPAGGDPAGHSTSSASTTSASTTSDTGDQPKA
jgi:hypothetical protein